MKFRIAGALLVVAAAVVASPHSAPTEPKRDGAKGPDCVDQRTGDFTVDFKLARDRIYDRAFRFLGENPSNAVTAPLEAAWDALDWSSFFRDEAKQAADGHRRYRRETIDRVKERVKQVRAKRSAADDSLDRKFDQEEPSDRGPEPLIPWMRRGRDVAQVALSSPQIEALRDRVLALPEVARELADLERNSETLRLREKALFEKASAIHERYYDELTKAARARGDTVDAVALNEQARALAEADPEGQKIDNELAEVRESLRRDNDWQISLKGGYQRNPTWPAIVTRTPRSASPAERAIARHFHDHPDDRKVMETDAELRRLLGELSVEDDVIRAEEKAAAETATTLEKEYRHLARVFARGATTGMGFAVAVARTEDGKLYPSRIVPVVGTPKLPGLGVPVRLFSVDEDADDGEIRRGALAALGGVLEHAHVALPEGPVACVEKN